MKVMGFSPDGKCLIYGDGKKSKLLNLEKGTICRYEGDLRSIFFTPDSNFMKGSDNSFELVNPNNGIVISRVPIDTTWINMVTYSSDMSYAAIASNFGDNRSYIYSVKDSEFIKGKDVFNAEYKSHIMHPFSPNLLIVLTNKALTFYDVRDFTQLASTRLKCYSTPRFVLSKDGNMLIVAKSGITGPHIYVVTNSDYKI